MQSQPTSPAPAARPVAVAERKVVARTRLVLADDHELIVSLLTAHLEPDFAVVGRATDGEALVGLVESFRPDLVLTDIGMPRLGGLEACRRIMGLAPATKVVFLTMERDECIVADAFAMGARGYVLKTNDAAELLRALRAVERGEQYLSPGIAGGDLEGFLAIHASPLELLSPREKEVLTLSAMGLSMKAIAHRLGITTRTVGFHKYRGLEALGLRGGEALMAFALRHRLIG